MEDRIWFIYLGQSHEGPFSQPEICRKRDRGEIIASSYLWKEDMQDWQQLHELSAFFPPTQKEIETTTASVALPKRTVPKSLYLAILPISFIALHTVRHDLPPHGLLDRIVTKSLSLNRKMTDAVPVLHHILTPVPKLAGVSHTEHLKLKETIHSHSNTEKASIHASQHALYVGSNMRDGFKIQVEFHGIFGTLVGELTHYEAITTTLYRHLARIALDGITPGKYIVHVLHNKTLLAEETLLLHASNQYEDELQEYHQKLREQSKAELLELSQALATIQSQGEQLQLEFQKYRSSSNKKLATLSWNSFHDSWGNMQEQLDKNMRTWTPEFLDTKAYHSGLYKKLPELSSMARQLQTCYQQMQNTCPFEDLQTRIQSIMTHITTLTQKEASLPPTGIPERFL